jgi:hypothetical protein
VAADDPAGVSAFAAGTFPVPLQYSHWISEESSH